MPSAFKKVHSRQDLLDFIPDNVPAQRERLAINPFAVRLVGEAVDPGVPRPGILAVNQDRDQNLTPILRQTPRELAFGRQSGRKPDQHLGRLIRVRNCYNTGGGFAFGLESQALSIYALEHRPTYRLHREGIRLTHLRRADRAADKFKCPDRETRVSRNDNCAEPTAIRSNGHVVGLGGRESALPIFPPFSD